VLQQIKKLSHGITVLYVEDNETLLLKAKQLLLKFFKTVYTATNGEDGLKMFKKHHPHIVLTDIKMPKMDGIEMAKHIHAIHPETKITFVTAFDEKEYLMGAIKTGAFEYLKKPVTLSDLTKTLYNSLIEIKHEQRKHLFQAQLGTIFNYQSSLVVMFKEKKALIANQPFLEFFNLGEADLLEGKLQNLGENFLEHDQFLYNKKSDFEWLEILQKQPNKIFNVKMMDENKKVHHFILKAQNIPEKEGYIILSFDDVTEMNLLRLFDAKKTKEDNIEEEKKALLDYLDIIIRNEAKVSLHNYYKGLSITNDGIIISTTQNEVSLKTSYVQQKAIQVEKQTYIDAEALPSPIYCYDTQVLSFEKQIVSFSSFHFAKTSPLQRETIRITPEEEHKVTLFIDDTKYNADIFIKDISLNAMALHLQVLPPGLEKEEKFVIDMVFTLEKQPLIINTQATFFKIKEMEKGFVLILMLELDPQNKQKLIKYISKRQLSIIREFKGLQNG